MGKQEAGGGAEPGAKVREGGGQRAGEGKPDLQRPLPLPIAHALGKCTQQDTNRACSLPPCPQLRWGSLLHRDQAGLLGLEQLLNA